MNISSSCSGHTLSLRLCVTFAPCLCSDPLCRTHSLAYLRKGSETSPKWAGTGRKQTRVTLADDINCCFFILAGSVFHNFTSHTWTVRPVLRGVAWARTRSPSSALLIWWMPKWTPATLFNPQAKYAPMLAKASAIIADTPPCNTLNGWQHLGVTKRVPDMMEGDNSSISKPRVWRGPSSSSVFVFFAETPVRVAGISDDSLGCLSILSVSTGILCFAHVIRCIPPFVGSFGVQSALYTRSGCQGRLLMSLQSSCPK